MEGEKMKYVCLGHATYDTTLPINNYPTENLKYRIERKIECGGGPASNAAYLLAKWKEDTTFIGIVGNDYYGQNIIKEFNHIGVHTDYIEKNSNINTDSSYIISNLANGSRTILTSQSKKIEALNDEIDIKDADVILVDGEHPESAKELLKNNPTAISVIDAGRCTKQVIELCKMVQYVVCSKDFAEEFTKIEIDDKDLNTLITAYEILKSNFQTTVVITLEAAGSFTKIETDYKIIPSKKVKAIDSTGAGDIFHGAFTYFISKNYSLEKTIQLASITGAISVTRIGSRYAIPSLEEVITPGEHSEII